MGAAETLVTRTHAPLSLLSEDGVRLLGGTQHSHHFASGKTEAFAQGRTTRKRVWGMGVMKGAGPRPTASPEHPEHFECIWPRFGSNCLSWVRVCVSRSAVSSYELSLSVLAAVPVPESRWHAEPPGKWEEATRLALGVCWTCCLPA